MSLELKEGDFANSVTTVAKTLLGPWYSENKSVHPQYVDDFLPVLRHDLEVANKTKRGDPSYPDFAIKGITDLANEHKGGAASRAVSQTVASLILSSDPIIEKTGDLNLRLIFDVSIGVAISNYQNMEEQALRDAAYHKSLPVYSTQYYLGVAKEHRKIVEWNKYLQDTLRQPVSISTNAQRK